MDCMEASRAVIKDSADYRIYRINGGLIDEVNGEAAVKFIHQVDAC